jgi:hypothetical protein
MAQEERPNRRRGDLLPIILIAIGVLVLLGNLNWMSWSSIGNVLNLWPVALLALGVDMLTRGRYRTAVVIGALVAGGLLYAADRGGTGFGSSAGAENHVVEHALDSARDAQVSIETGVSTLRIGSLGGGSALVRGTVDTARGETLVDDYYRSGGTAVLRLRSEQRPNVRVFGGDRRVWDLGFNDAVPMTLDISTGVGQAQLDLKDLRVSDLRVNAGVGEVRATLPSQGRLEAAFKAGVGETHVSIPQSMAARVVVNTGLGRVNVSGDFNKNGDTYTSPGYDSATDRVDLHIDGGLGQITVDRTR